MFTLKSAPARQIPMKEITQKKVKRFTTAAKLSEVMDVSRPTPLNWFLAGKIPGVKIGNVVRFPIAEVSKILGIDPEVFNP